EILEPLADSPPSEITPAALERLVAIATRQGDEAAARRAADRLRRGKSPAAAGRGPPPPPTARPEPAPGAGGGPREGGGGARGLQRVGARERSARPGATRGFRSLRDGGAGPGRGAALRRPHRVVRERGGGAKGRRTSEPGAGRRLSARAQALTPGDPARISAS